MTILKAFMLPPGVFITLVSLAWLLRIWSRLAAQVVGWSAFGLFLLSTLPGVVYPLAALFWQPKPEITTELSIDESSVVILGAGCINTADGNGLLGPSGIIRMQQGVRLAQNSTKPLWIIGGSAASGCDEVALMTDFLLNMGVSNFLIINDSYDTQQNIKSLYTLMDNGEIDSALLVSDGWHLLRVDKYMNKFLTDEYYKQVVLYPANDAPVLLMPWWRNILPNIAAFNVSWQLSYEFLGRLVVPFSEQ